MNLKGLPNGISDFKTIIENNYYYVDKTKLIEDIQQEIGKTVLFTRPRRFGKTLNISTLKYFFDIKNREENRKLFKDLYIEKSPYISEQGKYPVIYISLKDLKANTWENMKISIKDMFYELFSEHKSIVEELDEYDLPIFKRILIKSLQVEELRLSLKFLSKILYEKYNKKIVLLIDEYDNSLVSAYENNYYDEAIDFFRNFYSAALKDNEYLHIGLMTGILRVAKEGIFSGLNNLTIYNILDDEYSSYFGLTEEEVLKISKDYNISHSLDKIREWYNGYLFGKSNIYNPWSIISYIDKKKLLPYWINTSSNALINQMLEKTSKTENNIFEDLELLFNNKSITKKINTGSDFHDLIRNQNEIWQLFLYSGYLTIEKAKEDSVYDLRIPNKEVFSFFKDSFIAKFLGDYVRFTSIIDFLENRNFDKFEKTLEEILIYSLSYFDISNENEKFYHIFMVGLIANLKSDYYVSSNRESEYGRYDICLEPRNKNRSAYIFEFKIANSEKDLVVKSKEALKQIEEKNYDANLKERGIKNIVHIGIAFYGKKLKLNHK